MLSEVVDHRVQSVQTMSLPQAMTPYLLSGEAWREQNHWKGRRNGGGGREREEL